MLCLHWIWSLQASQETGCINPSSDHVWRAMMSSSFVGTTHAETLLCAVDIRDSPLSFAAESKSTPSHEQASQIRRRIYDEFSPIPAVNTSASMPPSTAVKAPISFATR